jgi:hypothetical protein
VGALLFILFFQLKENPTYQQLGDIIIVKKYITNKRYKFHLELRISELDWKENPPTGIPFKPLEKTGGRCANKALIFTNKI